MDKMSDEDSKGESLPEYDLSFLAGHIVSSISFGPNAICLMTEGPNYNASNPEKDEVFINIEADFELNGTRNCRADLLTLLQQAFAACRIDSDFNLRLSFISGDKLVVFRSNSNFESYSIDYRLDRSKFIVI